MVLCTCVYGKFVHMVFTIEEDAIVFTYYCKVVWCGFFKGLYCFDSSYK
jgi:hypothetical protein